MFISLLTGIQQNPCIHFISYLTKQFRKYRSLSFVTAADKAIQHDKDAHTDTNTFLRSMENQHIKQHKFNYSADAF